MADIIAFPTPAEPLADRLRRNIVRLNAAARALGTARDNLARHHGVLGTVKQQLEAQARQAHALAALAASIEQAIAADDRPAMTALQHELLQVCTAPAPQLDAAD